VSVDIEDLMKNHKILTLGISFIAVFLALSVFSFLTRRPDLRGAALRPPKPAAEFSLSDHNGDPFRMSAQRGKVVVLYFGFVNCPDECPLTMAHVSQALRLLGGSAREVQVVMVSTEPQRDTPQALRQFLANFDRSFLGIPGAPEQLAAVWKAYGVEVLEGGETHSSLSYVIDRSGIERETFTPDTSAEDIAHDLGVLLAEK
jgi:protein SCO1/2